MSSKKKKFPNEVPQSKIKEILKERDILKQTKRYELDDLPEGIHEIREISRDEGTRRIEEIFRKIFVD